MWLVSSVGQAGSSDMTEMMKCATVKKGVEGDESCCRLWFTGMSPSDSVLVLIWTVAEHFSDQDVFELKKHPVSSLSSHQLCKKTTPEFPYFLIVVFHSVAGVIAFTVLCVVCAFCPAQGNLM